jgi:hypothetical protein
VVELIYSKYEDVLAEAVLGFSQGLSLVIPRTEHEEGVVKGLTKITHIPSSRLRKSDEYFDQITEVPDKNLKPPVRLFRAGKYLVKIAVLPATQEVFSSCECMDFIIRMRHQEAACKHIAATLRVHYPQVVTLLLRGY